jgi:hypothetical protein
MLKFITSLSFLYAFAITVMLAYGFIYYRDFTRARLYKRKFPFAFLLVAIACLGFLWINIHAPLKLKTFSNLDHHFIRHDGFAVGQRIELGRADTVNYDNTAFNRFVFEKKNEQVMVNSIYSEEPFYASESGVYKIVSAHFPATNQPVSFQCDSLRVSITVAGDSSFRLSVNNSVFNSSRQVRKGLSVWNVFRDHDAFINSTYYTHEKLVSSLKNILFLRDNVSKKNAGELVYFFSGKLFRFAGQVKQGERVVRAADLSFATVLPNESTIAWGISFLDNNRNQFRVKNQGADSFLLLNRFPTAYPLTEEDKQDWTNHSVNKFLVAGSNDLLNLPPVFKEGFLFSSFSEDSSTGFSPVLLSYNKAAENKAVQLKAQWLDHPARAIRVNGSQLVLPVNAQNFGWIFSIRNTYDWELGSRTISPGIWQGLIFFSLLFFIVLVLFTAWTKPAHELSWVWQLLSCVTLVLLTTRFFLYWRYKSFPPYEGMDIPSLQQLNSVWNFGIIVLACVMLGLVFGGSFLKYGFEWVRGRVFRLVNRSYSNGGVSSGSFMRRISQKVSDARSFVALRIGVRHFLGSWLIWLAVAGGIAAFNNFDSGICRHLSIGLMILYFIYVFISYQYSPLVKPAEKSWWTMDTNNFMSLAVSNPVKILLSVSLLGVFAFIDIGFSIVFLNFLLFNEAFLCINYSIAGLSAGSRKNAGLFGIMGFVYLALFAINLLYAPYIFHFLLQLPQQWYLGGYIIFSFLLAGNITRVFVRSSGKRKWMIGAAITVLLFAGAWFFFPKERVLDKAGMTRYRINVQIMPAEQAITQAYEEGKTYEPVIRAAQNQWFINTFIDENNNPGVLSPSFRLLPHAPQNKGARYNAQATDLVASRFFIAEHGQWSVLLYILLLLLPATLLASFYKLYPDFTNRINNNYPAITAGFSILNYLLTSALLVILAATGKYIFFGQDLPFGSILSKQSILVPSLFIIICVALFTRIPQEHYTNRRKMVPGILVFSGFLLMLLFVKPVFNRNKEFNVAGLAKNMETFTTMQLQPIWDYFDSSKATRRLSLTRKDRLFSDSLRQIVEEGRMDEENKFFLQLAKTYSRSGFSQHLDASRMLYLDVSTGNAQLAVNPNYFRIEPPPHLQQSWKGNIYSDTTAYNICLWDAVKGSTERKRLRAYSGEPATSLEQGLTLLFLSGSDSASEKLCLINRSGKMLELMDDLGSRKLNANDSVLLSNPYRARITEPVSGQENILVIEPDAYMKNYYVNGSRFYAYPMANRFNWARNFAESISPDYTSRAMTSKNAFVSFDYEIMDSLSQKIQSALDRDTAYKKGAEYGICIADGSGRLVTMIDFIKGMDRPDPNDKAAFNKAIEGNGGYVSQAVLRKQIGNINLLRLNPGPGSTLKPIVFSAIASQLNLDWDAFAAEGFSEPQRYYGGEKVPEYDFEKNNGRISNVTDYLKYSDNYYHSDVLLLGSYPKQDVKKLLAASFVTQKPGDGLRWPYFNYEGATYYLDDFKNWPGYNKGKANFGSDSSFISIGLLNNYGIYTKGAGKSFDRFATYYDSSLFMNGWGKSGYILPEYSLFDQQALAIDHRIPYDLFTMSFRGHVKGSSQVMIPPVKMVEAFGRMITQNKNYSLTLNPYALPSSFSPFYVDENIGYARYLSLMRENVFTGMKEALFSGTAARLGTMLKNGSPWYYYAKTGTTGDNEAKTKSKLFAIVISKKDIADPGFNFRNNKFYTIYFTSQNGPVKQNEELQAEVIRFIERSPVFQKYMND